MSAIPGDIDPDRQPPMSVPLRHFLVGLGCLLVGVGLGAVQTVGWTTALSGVALRHLLLLGWVGITIMGAMTQFVPVWSGVDLHNRRLASVQLLAVTTGLVGLVVGFLTAIWTLLPLGGALLVAGFWVFIYNIGRTLHQLEEWDVTERHFGLSLAFLGGLTLLGLGLAIDLHTPFLEGTGVGRSRLISAHATLAVFGFVLTTVVGALYQLATMFTQTELRGVDHPLQGIETVVYPIGVILLAGARLLGRPTLARAGGVLVATGLSIGAWIVGRRLYETRVPWTPMLRRYAVAVLATLMWVVLTLRGWLADPLTPAARLGGSGSEFLLLFGVIGFVVVGTSYHVVPFIVWVHRYSDRLGFEQVPMIEDLFDDRLAMADLLTLVSGTALLVAAELLGTPTTGAGWGLLVVSVLLFVTNLLGVVHHHSPYSIGGLLGGARVP